MSAARVQQRADGVWELGNERLAMAVEAVEGQVPRLTHLASPDLPGVEWAVPAGGSRLGPVLEIAGKELAPGAGLTLAAASTGPAGAELCLHYTGPQGLEVRQYLTPSQDKPAWTARVEVENGSGESIDDIARFDAADLEVQAGPAHPLVSYVLGWLEGPRAEGPGRPTLTFQYDGWIPKFLYGEGAPIPPPPPGGWQAPAMRVVQERLTRLPLRSGGRSTYENHPWAAVRDPGRGGGFFLGFQWSGTWKMEVEHHREGQCVSAWASSDGCVHCLAAGETLASPTAFLGLFAGDWDDATNACRRYTRDELISDPWGEAWPTALHVYCLHQNPADDTRYGDEAFRREVDAAAAAGFETTYVESNWWTAHTRDAADFSQGLGDFSDNRDKFPMGLKAMSDYVHAKGMKFGLWFEIERVDLRTAHQGRNPWRPEWLVHRNGYPYRSWGQHFYMLCLGVREAAEWALENMSWAVEEYGLDWIMLDSNEWAVCDDPTHDHGPGDGEWAQIQGLYHVLGGLRQRFPDLLLENSAGGGQRGDFGMARFCSFVHPHDNGAPSSRQRRYLHGLGCFYPNCAASQCLWDYPEGPINDRWGFPYQKRDGTSVGPERLEWRALNRLMGMFAAAYEFAAVPAAQRQVMEKALETYKRVRRALRGDRYVLAGPEPLVQPHDFEADNWEAYQFVARAGDLVAVFVYRCASPEGELVLRLRGLDPQATYRVESHRGMPATEVSGAALADGALTCHLPEPCTADVLVLARR